MGNDARSHDRADIARRRAERRRREVRRRRALASAVALALVGVAAWVAAPDGSSSDGSGVARAGEPLPQAAPPAARDGVARGRDATTASARADRARTLAAKRETRPRPSDKTRLKLRGVITGNISPKSVESSGGGLVSAQNMMYRHTVTVYDRARCG